MSNSSAATSMSRQRGDFSTRPRMLAISGLALIIGAIATVVAKVLLMMIALVTQILYYGRFSFEPALPSSEHWGAWFILVPAVGGLIIGLMARYGSEKIRGHGIPEALEAILFGKSIMQPRVAILKPISSAISIGSGGPFGAEGPIVMTGGAFGSIIAQFFHLTAAERKTLLVAGAAAGMSAIFATPIAAVLLAIELLLFELKPRSVIPVGIAAGTAAILRVHFFGHGPLFPIATHPLFGDSALLQACVLGLTVGAFATLASKTLYWLEDSFHKLPMHWMWWPAIGGLVVGLGGWLQPRALGVGYDVIADFLSGAISPGAGLELLGVKAVIWLIALASGTSGGVLAPLLIFGCSVGAAEGHWLFASVDTAPWALIGMGAMLAGMMRSPFTAILFAFELTHDPNILLPLLLASLFAYGFTVLVMKRSILTEKIARRGYDIFREYSVDPLERLTVSDAMNPTPETIGADVPLAHLVNERFPKSKHRGFPVVTSTDERDQKLVGVLVVSDLAKVPALDDARDLTAKDLLQRPPVTVQPQQTCREAASLMAEHDIGRLPVVSPDDTSRLVGLITRSDLLKARRHQVHEEDRPERVR